MKARSEIHVHEIREVVGEGEDKEVREADLDSMAYLKAVILGLMTKIRRKKNYQIKTDWKHFTKVM